jgi:hypothetical protein
MRKSFLAFAFMAVSSLLVAQQTLNNDSIIKLVKAGLSDDLIVSTINAAPGGFDTSADGLIALKTAGVSDKVVSAIVTRSAPPSVAPAAPAAVQSGTTASVHFYRYKQYLGSALKPSVYCDSSDLGRLGSGTFLDVTVPVGPHTFYAEDKQAGAMVTLEAGKDYYFRADVQTGFWKGHFRLTMVMPDQGKYDVTKLKPLESKNATHDLSSAPASH